MDMKIKHDQDQIDAIELIKNFTVPNDDEKFRQYLREVFKVKLYSL